LAAIAGETRKIRAARPTEAPRTIFFITISFLERSTSREPPALIVEDYKI
jgi:hypothetical protein